MPCGGPGPTSNCTTCRAVPTWSGAVAALLRPGDLCLTLGAGDLTSLPDELMAVGRRPASPHEPSCAGISTTLAARLGGAAERDAPLGSRTTYRVGGTAALAVEATDEAALVGGGPGPRRSRRPGPGASGTAPTSWWPTPGSPGLVVTLGPGFADLVIDGHRGPGRRRPWPCPPWPGARQRPA